MLHKLVRFYHQIEIKMCFMFHALTFDDVMKFEYLKS